MILSRTLFALLTASLVAPIAAQNMVTNGDFSQVDPAGAPIGWTLKNFDFAPKVVSFDTAGFGADNALSAVHGKGTTSSTGIAELVQGGKLILQNRTYEVRADVAVGGSFNNDPGKFEVFVDGVSVATADLTTSRGSKPVNVTYRERICVQFVSTTTNVAAEIKIAISRTFASLPGRTPVAYVDNVFLGGTDGPTLCVRGERAVSTSVTVDLLGRPNTPVAFYIASQELPVLVTVPGWSGKFGLGGLILPLLFATTDGSGVHSFKATTPAVPLDFFVQGGQTNPSTSIDLGFHQRINIY